MLGLFDNWKYQRGPTVQFMDGKNPLTIALRGSDEVIGAIGDARNGSYGPFNRRFGPINFTVSTLGLILPDFNGYGSNNATGAVEHFLGGYSGYTVNLGNNIGVIIYNKTGLESGTRFPVITPTPGLALEDYMGYNMTHEVIDSSLYPINIPSYYPLAGAMALPNSLGGMGTAPGSILNDKPRSQTDMGGNMYQIFYFTVPKAPR